MEIAAPCGEYFPAFSRCDGENHSFLAKPPLPYCDLVAKCVSITIVNMRMDMEG